MRGNVKDTLRHVWRSVLGGRTDAEETESKHGVAPAGDVGQTIDPAVEERASADFFHDRPASEATQVGDWSDDRQP